MTGGRLEVTALGDEVNECARIQQSARDGQILGSKTLIERLSEADAAALGIDPGATSYRALGELPGVDVKAVAATPAPSRCARSPRTVGPTPPDRLRLIEWVGVSEQRDELFLIDGNSLAYRAFFALPESIATSTGVPTNAIFGFASMLVKILTEYGPKPTVVVWDAGSSGRTETYSEYKAQRRSRPDLLKEQWPHLAPLVEAFGYRNVQVEGYEADDVIASIAERAREQGIPVMVVTGDRDAFQLIDSDDLVRVMATSRGITETKLYDRQAVVDRYGIPPELIPDFYGLKGDTSDNIPGVPGIGDKTASELLQRFGTLEEVLAHVDDISGAKRKQNLIEHAENARLSRELAILQRDIDAGIDPQAEVAREPDRSRLRDVFREFELRDPLRRLEEALGDPDAAAPAPVADQTIQARERAGTLADIAGLPAGEVAIAARAPETPEGELVPREDTWRFGAAAGGVVIAGDTPGPEELVAAVGDRPVVAHDAKSLRALPRNLAHDTLLGAYLLDPARRGYPFREVCEERGLAAGVEDPVAQDAVLVGALAAWQREQIAERGLEALLEDVELPLVPVLRAMELRGRQARHRAAGRDHRAGARRDPRARAGDLGRGGGGVRARLAPAARGDPLRQARPLAQAPRQDRLLHRRPGAPGHPRRAPDHAQDRALARAQPAREDLPRRAPRAGGRAQPHPHHLRAGGRHHRGGWPPPTPTCRTSPSARRWAARSAAASWPRRATSCSRWTTRRSSCGCWPTWPASPCSRRSSPAARTCTPPPRCGCSAWRRRGSTPACAPRPR